MIEDKYDIEDAYEQQRIDERIEDTSDMDIEYQITSEMKKYFEETTAALKNKIFQISSAIINDVEGDSDKVHYTIKNLRGFPELQQIIQDKFNNAVCQHEYRMKKMPGFVNRYTCTKCGNSYDRDQV